MSQSSSKKRSRRVDDKSGEVRSATIPDLIQEDGVFVDGDWVESKDQDPQGGVRLIQLADIGDGVYRNRSARFLTSAKAKQLRCTFLKPGDLLIARMPDPLGRACIFPGDEKPSVTVVDVCIVRTGTGGTNHRWLMHRINAADLRSQIAGLQSGSTRKRISRSNLARIRFVVPTLDEQQRIVADIDKQFTRLEAGLASLKRSRVRLERFRNNLLNTAFDDRWPELEIREIGETVTGSTPPTKDAENYGDALPFIKPTDLNVGYHVEEARGRLSLKGARVARVLPRRTVLVTCIGATIGKTGLARVPCATNQQINAIIPNDHLATPEWLYWTLTSPRGQEMIKSNASATTLPIINKRRFESLKVPVPPLNRQREIVADLESKLTAIENCALIVNKSFARAERLRQSILARAVSRSL